MAPEFELKDQKGTTISIRDFRGSRLLIAFFPFAFSPVCSDELREFQCGIGMFREKGVEIVCISIDSSWSAREFSSKLGISFPVLSDFGRDVARQYCVLRPEGFAERAYFLVDEKGKVMFKHVMGSPGERLTNLELLEKVG